MVSKEKIYAAFKLHIESKIQAAQDALEEATESVHAETKGSAGDKHETGRAMAQLEVEKAGKVLHEAQQMRSVLSLLEPEKMKDTCIAGALVKTTQGIFYLSGGIGKIEIEDEAVFCIGMNSPVGQALIGKQKNEKYTVAGNNFTILDVI